MASISSVNSTGSSLTSSIRGFGGLASGLDRDTLIEQFTAGTRSKIAQQKQKQQKLQWTQEAIRGISDKIYDFSSKFTSFSSSSNLTSSKLFSRSQISVNGVNSKYVSATGSAASAENLSINRVKQLARNATMNTGAVSSKTLTTANLGLGPNGELDTNKEISTIAGDMLYVKYGNSTYGVTMTDGGKNAASAVNMINEQLKTVEISGGKKLSDVMKATVSADGKIGFEAIDNANGNRLELAGGTGDILKDLGFLKEGEKFDDLSDTQKNIAQTGGLTAANAAQVTKEEKLYNLLSEKKLTFSYNGTKGEIKLDKYDASTTLDKVKNDLQTKLDEAFGKGRIQVGDENGSLSFKTMIPGGTEDKSSTLSILSGAGLVGEGGVFGIAAGASNRINLSASVDKAGFKTADFSGSLKDDGSYYLSINGVEIEGITKDSTVKEIVEKINNSKAGVKVSYQSISDQFVITSTENGAAGEITFDAAKDGKSNLAALMFGTPTEGTNYTKGQDAILSVSYPGSNQEIEITRSSNSFDLDGINVTLKGTFGYDASGAKISDTEAVTFTGSVDSENTTKTVKEMIEAFNDILKLVNTEVSTKPNRKYAPLTDEQKEELSDKTIEKWEEKAKAGLLFADSDLRMMANSMRTVINAADRSKLSEMGITVSDNYKDNGKLVFDEAKFKAALEKDPEAVREVLNRSATDSGDTSQAGLLTRISSIMDRYGKTTGATKGVLVERAGSVHAPTSILKNSLQKQLDSIDTYIDKLNDKLKTEQDRYISQFTSLETLINQMNSQSSYLSSMFSY